MGIVKRIKAHTVALYLTIALYLTVTLFRLLLAAVVVLTILLALTLLSPAFRHVFANLGIDFVNAKTPFTITVTGLHSRTIDCWHSSKFTIELNGDKFIVGEELSFCFKPTQLLKGEIAFRQIATEELSIALPQSKPDEGNAKPLLHKIKQFKKLIHRVSAEQITVERLYLPEIIQLLEEPLNLIGDLEQRESGLHLGAQINNNAQQFLNLQVNSPKNTLEFFFSEFTFHEPVNGPLKDKIRLSALDTQALQLNAIANILYNESTEAWEAEITQGYLLEQAFTGKFAIPFQENWLASDVKIRWDISPLNFNFFDNSLNFSGHYSPRAQSSLNIKLEEFIVDHLEFLVPPSPSPSQQQQQQQQHKVFQRFKGASISGELTAAGYLKDAKLQTALRIDKVMTLPVHAKGNAHWISGDLKLNNSEIKLGSANYSANGTVNTNARTLALKGRLKNLKLDSLRKEGFKLPETLTGTINAKTLTLKGPFNNIEILAPIEVRGTYKGINFEGGGSINKIKNVIELHNSRIDTNNTTILGKLAYHMTSEKLTAKLSFENRSLDDTALLNLQVPPALKLTTNAQIEITGTQKEPLLQIKAESTGTYNNTPIQVNTDSIINKQSIKLNKLAIIMNDQNTVSASGLVSRDVLAIKAQITPTVDTLNTITHSQLAEGEIQADVNINGSLIQPKVSAEVGYTIAGLDMQQNLLHWQTNLLYQNENLRLTSAITSPNKSEKTLANWTLTKSKLRIKQILKPANYTLNHWLDHLGIKGELNLAALNPFFLSPDKKLSGLLLADIETKTLNNVLLTEGSLNIKQAALDAPYDLLSLSKVNCTINVKNQVISIPHCKGQSNESGVIDVTGNVKLPQDNQPSSIAISSTITDLPLRYKKTIESLTNGILELKGDFDQLNLTGNLKISPLRISLPKTNAALKRLTVKELKVTEHFHHRKKNKQRSSLKPALPKLHVDVKLTADQRAYLVGQGLDAELVGRLSAQGDVPNVNTQGKLSIKRGTFIIFGKKFIFSQGELYFANKSFSINAIAHHSAKALDINAQISGDGDSIKIALSSNPEQPEEELLSQIFFGKSFRSISPYQAIQLTSAIRSLQQGSKGFIDPIEFSRNLLSLDSLYIGSSEEDANSDEQQMHLAMGKHLNDRVYLELKHTPDSKTPWQTTIEIKLTNQLQLESSSSNKSLEGIKLLWGKDF